MQIRFIAYHRFGQACYWETAGDYYGTGVRELV